MPKITFKRAYIFRSRKIDTLLPNYKLTFEEAKNVTEDAQKI